MCLTVTIFNSGHRIETVSDLLKIVDEEFIVLNDGVTTHRQSKQEWLFENLHNCLCCINITATFVGLGRWTILPYDHAADTFWIKDKKAC